MKNKSTRLFELLERCHIDPHSNFRQLDHAVKLKFHEIVVSVDDEMSNITLSDLWQKIGNYKQRVWKKKPRQDEHNQN
jgi:hypothetical protein